MIALARLRERVRHRAAEWARRRQGADRLPLTLGRRRLYILPTRAGIGFAVSVVTMLVAGLNYTNSVALLLAFVLGGFALVAMHQCHRNVLGLSLLDAVAAPLFAGSEGNLRLTLENASRLGRYRVQVTAAEGGAAELDLLADSHGSLDVPVRAGKRGLQRIDRLRLSSTHPYGLFRVWTWIHAPIVVIVYPRPAGSLPLPADSGARSGTSPRDTTGADEWLGLRPFRDGDSPRQVAWKAYAREAPLLVKEYSSAGATLRMLSLEQARQPDIESRLAQLARWIVDADAHGDLYGLDLPGERIPAHRGADHRHRCLAALALHGSPPPTSAAAREAQ